MRTPDHDRSYARRRNIRRSHRGRSTTVREVIAAWLLLFAAIALAVGISTLLDRP